MTASTTLLETGLSRARYRVPLQREKMAVSRPFLNCAVLVDSNLVFAGSVRDAAARHGMSLVHATGVLEGLDVLACSSFRTIPPSHMIFDLDLPDGQGVRVLEAAERGFPWTTIIALASNA